MTTSTYTITEVIGEGNISVTGELDDIWETVESWFELGAVVYETEDGETVTIADQLDDLRSALPALRYTGDLENALGLRVE